MANQTVPVPDDRTAEFYQFFGLWLAGALSLPGSPEKAQQAPSGVSGPTQGIKEWGNTEEDYADAETLWKKYSPNARAMFSLLIDNPDKDFTGDEIAKAVGIPNGAHGVAGVLAWPGRHGAPLRRWLPTSWREDPETLDSYYWMPKERAELFKVVRAKVEGKG